MRFKLTLVCSVLVAFVGCDTLGFNNPFGPSNGDVIQGVSMQPSEVILPIGAEHTFSVRSAEGRLEGLRIYLVGAPVYDDECACERYVELGHLRKISPKSYRYRAPTGVREGLELPLVLTIAGAYGDVGHGAEYRTLSTVTITR